MAPSSSSSLLRYLSPASATPSLSMWATLADSQPALLRSAQTLFDQIVSSPLSSASSVSTRPASLMSSPLPSTARRPSAEATNKIWAVVAVVATAIAEDLKARRRPLAGRKRKRRSTNGKEKHMAGGNDGDVESASGGDDDRVDGNSHEDDEDEDDDEQEQEPEPEADADARQRQRTWHLVDALVDANISLTTFLQHLTSLFDRLLLDPELLEVTTQLKENFTVATVLFEKYRVMWKKVTLQADVATNEERTELLFRFGWLLFLECKRRLHRTYTGLGPLYFLLLAVLHLVVSHVSETSTSILSSPKVAAASVEAEAAAALSALGAAPKQNGSSTTSASESDQRLLELLCASPKVEPKDIITTYCSVISIINQMAETSLVHTLSADGGAKVSSAELIQDVLSSKMLRQNTSQLADHYAAIHLTGYGVFDERVYLSDQSRQVVLGPRPPVPGGDGTSETQTHGVPPATPNQSARRDRSNSSAEVTPSRLGSPPLGPRTPVRRTIDASGGVPQPPPSPFTVQAWQWHGASPPPNLSISLPRGLNTPVARALGGMQHSPHVSQTPVTAAVETSNWIRDTLSATPTFVTPQLRVFFRECATDPTEHIADILHELSEKLLSSRRRTSAPSSPAHRRDTRAPPLPMNAEFSEVEGSLKKMKNLAITLFYRVLEALLRTERDRLRSSNFTTLLRNETFISSLFTCSLEVVLKAHGLITLSFPFLLGTLGVNAFDFGKVIESFVKHVPKLPSTLKRHMRDLEQVILDSLAWRSDSGLYVVLAGTTSGSSNNSGHEDVQTNETSGSSAAEDSGATPTSNNAASTAAPRSTVLQLFFRKVLSLAASRIFRLGNSLELDAAVLNQVWTAIKECISTHHDLLKDRHLDQVILCSIYGVCKVNHVKPEVTFKRIIDAYKKLQTPHWSSNTNSAFSSASLARPSSQHNRDVIRDILLDDRRSRGDIIKFYNRCFIPTMKVFLLQFQAQETQMAAANAVVSTATTTSTSDSVIVAEAAASAAEKVMQSYGAPRTPVRQNRSAGIASPPLFGSPTRALSLFTTTEVESLPVSVHQTSPKRVLTSNIYMSPIQNARLHQHRTQMTPRSHALYAFGESPSRDLALINRAVNNGAGVSSGARSAPPPPRIDSRDGSSSTQSTPSNKRRRL
ncbi:hypothetical protein PINS_up000947 [Pythium insidiosum]|nr:hypothetical protein PINS_up000947 [Pythium insidiosum]